MDGFKFPRGIAALAAVAISLAAPSAWAATINVPADQPTIQDAINAASNGDTVLVAPGTYYELIDFTGKAITVQSSGGAAATILDGNGSGPLVSFQSGETSTSVLEGFTLRNAMATVAGSAVYLSRSSATIIGNIFLNNTEATGLWGAAIGGDVSSPVVIGNLFKNNSCDSQFLSGVVVVVNDSVPTIVNNVFLDNPCRAVNMTIPTGLAAYVSNNTFVGNSVGILVDAEVVTSAQVYRNNLLFENTVGLEVDFGSAANYPTWKNNLVFGSTTADYQGIPDQTDIDANLSANPLLKDPADGDVHLLYGSPAIDVGDMSTPALPATDYYGAPRVFAGNPGDAAIVDIGAAEYEPPVVTAVAGSIQTPPGIAVNGTLASANADPGEPLTFALVTLAVHGTVTLTNAATGAFRYVPAPGYLGADSFTFDVVDPYGTVSNTATEQVTVQDLAPTANNGSVNTVPNSAVTSTLSATTAYSGQLLTFVLVSNPAHGTVILSAGTGKFTYTPAQGYIGTDSFTFEAKDQYGDVSNVATEQVNVGDAAPAANDGSVHTTIDTAVSGMLSGTAAYPGVALTFSIVSNPAHGTVSLTPGSGRFSYVPATGYVGADSFTFEATDAHGTVSNVATESVTVTDIAASLSNIWFQAYGSSASKGFFAASKRYPGQVLTFSIVSPPLHGTLTITNPQSGAYTYKSNPHFTGDDSFSIQAVDQWGTETNIATATILVH